MLSTKDFLALLLYLCGREECGGKDQGRALHIYFNKDGTQPLIDGVRTLWLTKSAVPQKPQELKTVLSRNRTYFKRCTIRSPSSHVVH